MSQPVLDPDYWKARLRKAPADAPHHAVYICNTAQWERIAAKHREILKRHVKPDDLVLDCGCGYGRLLGLMPEDWKGFYIGFDLSPDFIDIAMDFYRRRDRVCFCCADLRSIPEAIATHAFDLAVSVSVRGMIRREIGDAAWQQMEANIRRVAKRLLILEYDEHDEGELS